MKTYKHIEDYIEVIAGMRDPVTDKVSSSFLSISPISLARYDVGVVDNFGEQIESRIGFTDRQSDLAVKIVLKYEKQLTKLGIDISPAANPVFRIPIRSIDRSQRLWIEEQELHVKFPYAEKLVQAVKEMAKQSQGSVRFDRDSRVWIMALTEYNLNWVLEFAKNNNFEIDDQVGEYMEVIYELEKTNYKIELTVRDSVVEITNAAPELLNYVDAELGGLSVDNLERLIDFADILGYSIAPEIEEAVIKQYSPRLFNLMKNQDSKLDTRELEKTFIDVMEYAKISNRFPVYIFEPDLSGRLLTLAREYFDATLVVTATGKTLELAQSTKVVHFTKYQSTWAHKIPLLISSQGMMYGGDKQLLLSRSEKVVYLTPEVYNNISRGAKAVAS